MFMQRYTHLLQGVIQSNGGEGRERGEVHSRPKRAVVLFASMAFDPAMSYLPTHKGKGSSTKGEGDGSRLGCCVVSFLGPGWRSNNEVRARLMWMVELNSSITIARRFSSSSSAAGAGAAALAFFLSSTLHMPLPYACVCVYVSCMLVCWLCHPRLYTLCNDILVLVL